jgi:hypothetical protein
MGSLIDDVSGLFAGLGAVYGRLDAKGYGMWFWLVMLALATAFGIRRVIAHMKRGQITIGGTAFGTRTGLDASGAGIIRSARQIERKRSLSPFYGRPAILRALPYPLAVLVAWLWVTAPWLTAALAAGASVFVARAAYQWTATIRHRQTMVVPMARALGPALAEHTDRVLEGLIVPRDYALPTAEVVIPLPDDHRPQHIQEAARVVHERLGGEWRHRRSDRAPYVLTLSHKPAPPSYVSYEDVADLMIHGTSQADGLFQPVIGLGAEREVATLNFDGHVVHLGISAGTGAGKSNLMRVLATQFAIRSGGTARQTYIDVKGDEEGMGYVPGMTVLNDIGDVHDLDGIFRMWRVYDWHVQEMDARRRGLRGPKESWEPLIIFGDERNAFGKFSRQAWENVKEKGDPKTPPVFEQIYLLAVMGRSFKIRMIDAYQVMSAAATGGGNAQDGAEVRAQYGNKMLARFTGAMWDSLVGTRPRAQSSDHPGRWLHVNNAGMARSIQLPHFEPAHILDLCSYAGLDVPVQAPRPAMPYASPSPVPGPRETAPYELRTPTGDEGTGDTAPPLVPPPAFGGKDGEDHGGILLPFQPRTWPPPPPAPQSTQETASETEREEWISLQQACARNLIDIDYEAAKRRRTRAKKAGTFPRGRKEGSAAEVYLIDHLVAFFQEDETGQERDQKQA